MSQRTAKPADIKTLQDWVKRWPKASNLRFDKETREPTIYTTDNAKSGSIPWKREADVLTVLTQPSAFSEAAVIAARKRIVTLKESRDQVLNAGKDQLLANEISLLAAWRAYRAAPSAPLMQDVLAAEAALTNMEHALANKNRTVIKTGDFLMTYVPTVPLKQRGLPF